MDATSQRKVIEVLVLSFDKDEISLVMMCRIFNNFPDFQEDIIQVLKKKDQNYFMPSSIPHLASMYANKPDAMKACIEELEKKKKIPKLISDNVLGRDCIAISKKRG